MLNALKRAALMVANAVNNAKAAILGAVGVGAVVAGTSAPAGAVGPDFSSILTGLDASTATTAIIAAAVILATVGFAKWGAKKVGRFFG